MLPSHRQGSATCGGVTNRRALRRARIRRVKIQPYRIERRTPRQRPSAVVASCHQVSWRHAAGSLHLARQAARRAGAAPCRRLPTAATDAQSPRSARSMPRWRRRRYSLACPRADGRGGEDGGGQRYSDFSAGAGRRPRTEAPAALTGRGTGAGWSGYLRCRGLVARNKHGRRTPRLLDLLLDFSAARRRRSFVDFPLAITAQLPRTMELPADQPGAPTFPVMRGLAWRKKITAR